MSAIILKDKAALLDWERFREEVMASTTIDRTETPDQKRERIEWLEKDGNDEEWFKYYFPNYYTSEPADFHIEGTQRVMNNPEWYEVRWWSRELSKSGRSFMEDMKLLLTKKKRFKLLVSSSFDNACRLMAPYKINLESNNRIINDYGKQKKYGSWEEGEITTRTKFSIRAVGGDQAPRGARSEAVRPDIIEFDDLDTDQDCQNIDLIDKRWEWVTGAVIMTRSISAPTLIRWNGNKIAEDCCIVRASEYADHVSTVNIRNDDGLSSWPQRNTEEMIDRVLETLPYSTQQKECFNNPHVEGKTFKEFKWGKCPPIEDLLFVVSYADPATSNKDITKLKNNKQNSCKSVVVMGKQGEDYYIYKCWLHNMTNSSFIECMYEARAYVGGRAPLYNCIENNTLQDPFYEQLLLPMMYKIGASYGGMLAITPDDRKKAEKFFRIEADLEPINRLGHLIFNEEEKNDPHMKRLIAQFKSVSPKSKTMDGPDCVQGAKAIIDEKEGLAIENSTRAYARPKNKHRY